MTDQLNAMIRPTGDPEQPFEVFTYRVSDGQAVSVVPLSVVRAADWGAQLTSGALAELLRRRV